MNYTLLQMVQRILESMDSDEVNSYSDTIESNAVANIIKETYYYLTSKTELPSLHTFFNLDSSGDNTKPCLMTFPQSVLDIDYIKYNVAGTGEDSTYKEITFLPLEEFVNRFLELKESEDHVSTMTIPLRGVNFTFKFRNDRHPSFYTTVDDRTLLFDSYDSTVDNTLQSSKTICYGRIVPVFEMRDSFIPALEKDQFALLLNEAKSQAFVELKQSSNAHSERRAKKMHIHTQKTKRNIPSNVREIQRRGGYGRNV